MVALVQVHADAHVAQRRIDLRGPGTPGLPVRDGRHAEDPLNVPDALDFATIEFGAAVVPPGVLQIDGNGRLLTVGVRVIADVVALERGNHVTASTALEHAGLFADD